MLALPGVTAVGATTTLPLAGGTNVTVMTAPGAPGNTGDPNTDRAVVDRIIARPGYVEAMGMQLLEGRGFARGRTAGPGEALIDRHLANQFFPGRSPIGATIYCEGNSLTVVGVVDQTRLYDFLEDGRPQLFVRADDLPGRRTSSYVVRASGDTRLLMSNVQNVIRQIDRRVPVSQVRAMTEIVADRRSRERISAVLVAGLAAGALLLLAVGLFGVISGSVTRRRHELAVRLAHHRVLWRVLGEGALLVLAGVLIGGPGVYAAGRLLSGFLVGVSPWDLSAVLAGTQASKPSAANSADRTSGHRCSGSEAM